MIAITQHHNDLSRNMLHFYKLDVQRDFFCEWCFIHEWGRSGSAGQTRCAPDSTFDQALAALEHQRRSKEQRGNGL